MVETLPDYAETYIYEDITESEVQFNDDETKSFSESEESTRIFESETRGEFVVVASDVRAGANFSNLDISKLSNVWTVSFDGGSYQVLFPPTEDLVVIDGALVNIGSSSISGVVVGGSLDLTSYFQRVLTISPLNSSTSQTNALRYRAHSYMTLYTPTVQGTSFNTTVTYGNVGLVTRPKLGSTWSSVNVLIIGLLALQVLISFIGGLLRRG